MSRRASKDHPVVVSSAYGTWTVNFPDGAVAAFDAVGRPLSSHEAGLFYARGHDGRWIEKRWTSAAGAPRRHVRTLPPEDAARHEEALRRRIDDLRAAWAETARAGGIRDAGRRASSWPAWARRLDRISRTLSHLSDDVAAFRRAYLPVPILPPDQYLAWVVQAVEGCPWNRCAFCDFYAGRPGRVRSLPEILRHVDAAERYFGPAMARFASIFIGDADAFAAPPETLGTLCRRLATRHPRLVAPSDDGAWGIHAFGETRSLLAWPEDRLRALAKTGFRRVTIGLESGDDGVRRMLKKPGRAADLNRAVARVKGAGLSVGVVILLGAGGREAHEAHADETARLLRRLPLGVDDIVYLSPLKERMGAPEARVPTVRRSDRASSAEATAPTEGSAPDASSTARESDVAAEGLMSDQARLFRAAALDRPTPPRVAHYDVDEFLY